MVTSAQDAPFVIIFAGPNGSGKTSLIDEVRNTGLAALGDVFPVPEYFINPDQVAKDLEGEFATQEERDIAAQARGIALRKKAIDARRSFAYETVMSHPTRLNEIIQLKEQGYRVLLTFIATDHPDINVRRVMERYRSGTTTGHFVREDRVRQRYSRVMQLLPAAAELADAVFIYDNSTDFTVPKQVVVVTAEDVLVTASRPDWVTRHFMRPAEQRALEIEEFQDVYGENLIEADPLNGSYAGNIVNSTDNYAAQFVVANGVEVVVLHDRALLDAASEKESHPDGLTQYHPGEWLHISYAEDRAPIVRHMQA